MSAALGKLQIINYATMMFSTVKDQMDFFRTNLPEMKTVKALFNAIKLHFNTPDGRLLLQCAEGQRIYKYLILSNDVHKYPIANFIYQPLEKRLDFYSMDMPHIPTLQWKNKKPVFKNYSEAMDRAGIDKVFNNIINTL